MTALQDTIKCSDCETVLQLPDAGERNHGTIYLKGPCAHCIGTNPADSPCQFDAASVIQGMRELVEGDLITTSRAAEILGITVAKFRHLAYPRRGHVSQESEVES